MTLVRRAPWYVVPLGVFLGSRIVDAVLLLVVGRHQIPASDLPPDMAVPTLQSPPTYWHLVASWDGQWYRLIAEHGYPRTLPTLDGVVQQNAWAFYPGYPALVRVVMFSGLPFGAAASVVSIVAGAVAMCLLYRLVARRGGRFAATMTVVTLCFAPAAPIFQSAYTESLGLLLLVVGLILLERRRYGWLVLAAAALALTRPITAPLAVAAAVHFWLRWRHRDTDPFPVSERVRLGLATASLAAFAVAWPLITGLVVGDLHAYTETQTAWRDIAGNRPDTWLVSLAHGAGPGRWLVVVAVLGAATWIAWHSRRWSSGIRVWTVAYPLFILATTPATSSVIRYALLVGPAWWPFQDGSARFATTRARLALALAVAVIGTGLQLVWLRWYFVITPASHGTP